MTKPGRLIVLEGPDGVGKTTLAELVATHLNHDNERAIYASFPGRIKGTLGHLVYRIHHDPHGLTRPPSPAALQTLHIAAHIDAIDQFLKPAIESGATIVLDRYWWSTYVYGLVDGVPNVFLDKLIAVERELWGSLLPSRLLYVRTVEPYPTYSGDWNKWRRHRTAYDEMFSLESGHFPMQIIENNGHIEDTLDRMMSYL